MVRPITLIRDAISCDVSLPHLNQCLGKTSVCHLIAQKPFYRPRCCEKELDQCSGGSLNGRVELLFG